MAPKSFKNGYVKIDRDLLMSSVWAGSDQDVKVLWITLLALADPDGIVTAATPALANTAAVTVQRCEEILRIFQEPDPYSRSKAYEGRRIAERPDGGWIVLNYRDYRTAQTVKQAKHAEAMRKWREGKE